MASKLYNSMLFYLAKGQIDFDTDTFYAMLVLDDYVPDVDAHDFRNDVTNEVVTGSGYTAGGAATTVTVTQENANNRAVISFAAVTWAAATISDARAAVIYKRRGGASSADELVAYVDFGEDKSSSAGDFVATFSTPLYLSGPA